MKKRFGIIVLFGLSASLLFALSGCKSGAQQAVELKGTYDAHLAIEDWGSGIDEVIVALDDKIDDVSKEMFKVDEKKQVFDWQKPNEGLNDSVSKRTIEKVFLSDKKGKKVDEPSKYITLILKTSPEEGSYFLLSPDSPFSQYPEKYELNISLKNESEITSDGKMVSKLTVDSKIKELTTDADAYELDDYKAKNGTEYQYAHFEPEAKSDTVVVWLHGLLEGGTLNTDPYSSCLGGKVPELAKSNFQEFMSGANVLVPQCPTFWMDSSGKDEMVDNKIVSDGTSFYTESLYELINYYKAETNSEKVVIAGCSNGGYMGMILASEYGADFDSYVLICEAMEDRFISDEKIDRMKDLPLFFIYSKDDPLVDPTVNEKPTIERLRKAKASNLHVAEFDEIVDTSGKLKDDKGNPHNFGGHSAWVPFFNNEAKCDECDLSTWEWMGKTVAD